MNVEVKKTVLGKLVVAYDCPSCSERLRSSADAISNVETCPTCQTQFNVPGEREFSDFKHRDAQKAVRRKVGIEQPKERATAINTTANGAKLVEDTAPQLPSSLNGNQRKWIIEYRILFVTSLMALSIGAILGSFWERSKLPSADPAAIQFPQAKGVPDLPKIPVPNADVVPNVNANVLPVAPEAERTPLELLGFQRVEFVAPTPADIQMSIAYRTQLELDETTRVESRRAYDEARALSRWAKATGGKGPGSIPFPQDRSERRLFADEEGYKAADKLVSEFDNREAARKRYLKKLKLTGDWKPVTEVMGLRQTQPVFQNGSVFLCYDQSLIIVCNQNEFAESKEIIHLLLKNELDSTAFEWFKSLPPLQQSRLTEAKNRSPQEKMLACFLEEGYYVIWIAKEEWLPPNSGLPLTVKSIIEHQHELVESRRAHLN